ncbi:MULTISPECIES: SDR family NAD(P)-dependent oxidoreductase [Metabacillus]|uniref:Short-chain dehydrogenase n=1 Tax=Metabacillus indicus TaxID=246786 RepID=A0A084GKT4_METID|nr:MULTISPECIES: SDR family oxidoreductase [Metabacillus]KEZ47946.1 short-chain dehydrogenase [Metabacillus indicus]
MNENVLLVVGAGKGISLSTALAFGRKGFRVAMIARRKEALADYQRELEAHGIEARGFKADIASESQLKSAISDVIHAFGKVDVLLYNAAAGKPGKPTALDSGDLIADFKVSVSGALASTKEVLPYMNKGAILLTGGGLALHPYADLASLSIGKAGIRSLAKSLHDELKPEGIYAGTLTIKGFVESGTYYDSEKIADAFYSMYQNRTEAEVIYEETTGGN